MSQFTGRIKMLRRQTAFTLVEMLVVIVIISLLVTVIVQGFGYSMGLYQRVIKTQKNAYSEVLAYNWFRTSLSSQVAARPRDRGLDGSATELSTYTYQPLLSQQGLKTRIRWELSNTEQGTELTYVEGRQIMPIYRWPDSTGLFEYLNKDNQWINHWPPEKAEMPALPQALRIVITTHEEVRNYLVIVKVRLTPIVTMEELLYGR